MESVLKGTNGVISADASFISGQAVVTYDPDTTSPQALVAAINSRTFYRASLPGPGDESVAARNRNITLAFEREFDPRRTWQIGTRLSELQGVTDVNSLADGRVSVAFDPERVDPERIMAAVEEMGFRVVQTVDGLPSAEGNSGWSWSVVYVPVSGLLVLSALVFLHRRRRKSASSAGGRSDDYD